MRLRSKDDPENESMNRHAPVGYKIALQFFGTETRDQALKKSRRMLGIDIDDLRIQRGHFDMGENGDQEPEFRPFGWMVFVPEDY